MAAPHETIVERIRADHRTALERIAELEHRAGVARDDTRAPVFAPMMTDILDHMAAEDEFVYRLLAREREEWIESSRREHELIRGHLAVLGSGGAPASDWLARLGEMKRLIERHAGEEERVVLPELEMMYDLERLRDLGDEYARWSRGSR